MHITTDPARKYPALVSLVDDDDSAFPAEDIAYDLGPVLTSADCDIIALGRKAGRDGDDADLCPFDGGSREADLWHFGREAA